MAPQCRRSRPKARGGALQLESRLAAARRYAVRGYPAEPGSVAAVPHGLTNAKMRCARPLHERGHGRAMQNLFFGPDFGADLGPAGVGPDALPFIVLLAEEREAGVAAGGVGD